MEELLRKGWKDKLILVIDTEIKLYKSEESHLIIDNHDVLGATIINPDHYDDYKDFLKYINMVTSIKCKIFRDTNDKTEKKKLEVLTNICDLTSRLLEL